MMFAMEWRLPIVGEPRSSLRGVWAAATVILLLLGAGGLAAAVGSLGNGPVTQQFELPRWLRSRDRGAA
jgi:hypothetical protein